METAFRNGPQGGIEAPGFESFVRRYHAPLLRALTAMSHDREVAADAAQDAFVRTYLAWNLVTDYHDPAAWLYRVGINRCNDYCRSRSRAEHMLERFCSQLEQRPGGSTEIDLASDLDLLGALQSLPERQRAAATLYYVNDLPLEEIACLMKVSEGAVSSHLHRAREALRRVMEAD